MPASPATQAAILSQAAAVCRTAREAFLAADGAIRTLKALGMVTADPQTGAVTGVAVDPAAFAGTLADCDARDVLGLLILFGGINQLIGTDVPDIAQDGTARYTGDALLRLAMAAR